MRRAKRLWGLGAVLLLVSAYPLFLQAREASTAARAAEEYAVEPVEGATRVRLDAQEVAVTDAAAAACRDCAAVVAPVQTLVNGHAYSSDSPVVIQPRFADGRRYRSWVSFARVTEKKARARFLAVIQRVRPRPGAPGTPAASGGEELVFRLLLVGQDGSVHAETFPFTHREWPVYRALLVSRVSPPGMGVLPQVLQPWLGALYPILFPWGSAVLGVGLVAVATRLARRARPVGGARAMRRA
jgi:hypothetical protein